MANYLKINQIIYEQCKVPFPPLDFLNSNLLLALNKSWLVLWCDSHMAVFSFWMAEILPVQRKALYNQPLHSEYTYSFTVLPNPFLNQQREHFPHPLMPLDSKGLLISSNESISYQIKMILFCCLLFIFYYVHKLSALICWIHIQGVSRIDDLFYDWI